MTAALIIAAIGVIVGIGLIFLPDQNDKWDDEESY